MSRVREWAFGAVLLLLLFVGAVWGNFIGLPRRDTAMTHFDAIVVLGVPTNPDGTPSPEQRTRVAAAVQEYRAGRAPLVIVSGGAAHNRFVEADTMAQLAVADGMPPAAVIEERQAHNTIENIWYSIAILHARRGRSVEVVSSRSHLPRAALILQRYHRLPWRTYAAPWPPEFLRRRIATVYCLEALECLRLQLFGFPHSPYLPS